MNTRRVTIRDVAAEADVTAQTVSRVFGSKGYVSEETRANVLAAAKRLNYIPNNYAKTLRTGIRKNIAVIFDSLKNIYFAIIIDYLQREVQRYGYNLQTQFVNSHIINEDIYRTALSGGALAVISFLEAAPGLGAIVKNCGVPLMIFGRRGEEKEIDFITTDDIQGGRAVAEHLLGAGCKTFAYAAFGFGMTCVYDRLNGFDAALKEKGCRADVIDCSHGIEEAVTEYIGKRPLPDGIFCFSDVVAFELLKVLNNAGKKTKVVGYDDIESDLAMPFKITSVGLDKEEYVAFAVSKLLDKVEGRSSERIAYRVNVTLKQGETG